MTNTHVNIVLTFGHEDQAWLRHHKIAVPAFWAGHSTPPARGDVLRIGGRQYEVLARVWEHDGEAPQLRLFLSSGHADSDTNFQALS